MKIKTLPAISLSSLLCTAVVGALLMFSNRASAVSIRDARELALARSGTPSRYSDRSIYIDNLIGMALRGNETSNKQNFRSDASTRHTFVIDRAVPSRKAITIPSLSGVPSPGTGAVPDGGTTAMLLGAALSALGMARRYMMS
jgi:hypothetical protein